MLPEYHCPEESPELLTVLADSGYGKSNVNMSLGNFEPEEQGTNQRLMDSCQKDTSKLQGSPTVKIWASKEQSIMPKRH